MAAEQRWCRVTVLWSDGRFGFRSTFGRSAPAENEFVVFVWVVTVIGGPV